MSEALVHSLAPITLLGGGQADRATLDMARAHAPDVVAADGGARLALAAGLMPRAVIGDLDSLTDTDRACIGQERLHPIAEQDTTDFDKCLRSIEAPLILGVAFDGTRLDHQLACYNTLVRHSGKRCVLIGAADLVFLAPPSLRLGLPEGCRVSLFPLGAVEGQSEGLQWPINGLRFAPDGRVGTSNIAQGPIHLSVTAPKLLVILPRETLPQVVTALLAHRGSWLFP